MRVKIYIISRSAEEEEERGKMPKQRIARLTRYAALNLLGFIFAEACSWRPSAWLCAGEVRLRGESTYTSNSASRIRLRPHTNTYSCTRPTGVKSHIFRAGEGETAAREIRFIIFAPRLLRQVNFTHCEFPRCSRGQNRLSELRKMKINLSLL